VFFHLLACDFLVIEFGVDGECVLLAKATSLTLGIRLAYFMFHV